MRLVRPIPIDSSNFVSTNATITPDAEKYGDEWKGEWISGSYNDKDVVYKDIWLYESLQDSNTNDPSESYLGESAAWFRLGKINMHKVFDEFVNTQTVGPPPVGNQAVLEFIIEQPDIDSIAFFDLDAAYISVDILSPSNEVLANIEHDLWISTEDPIDWFEYWYGNMLPPTADAFIDLGILIGEEKIRIHIINVSDTAPAKCGMICVGLSEYIADTMRSPETSILDYSRRATDDFGRTYLRKGNWAKLVSATLSVHIDMYDSVHSRLRSARGTACVWNFNQFGTNYNSLLVYGFFQDFRIILQSEKLAQCNIEIQGLI